MTLPKEVQEAINDAWSEESPYQTPYPKPHGKWTNDFAERLLNDPRITDWIIKQHCEQVGWYNEKCRTSAYAPDLFHDNENHEVPKKYDVVDHEAVHGNCRAIYVRKTKVSGLEQSSDLVNEKNFVDKEGE